jgi:GTP cyclohydrolase I
MEPKPTRELALQAVETLLRFIGEDPEREGLRETPKRVLASFEELYGGYKANPAEMLKTFRDGGEDVDEMIVQRNIPFFSMCEHHMLPFHGVVHLAYIPNHLIVGLSKLARLVEVFARRLQVQERMTNQIADALMEGLSPKGAACVVEATHLCMVQRGVKKHCSDTITSALRGGFRKAETRSEFLNLIHSGSNRPSC